MSALNDTAAVASICAGIVLPCGAILVWFARSWVHREIVSKLSNDDTPVAKYAHDARDYAKEARDMASETNRIVIDHVTNMDLHSRYSVHAPVNVEVHPPAFEEAPDVR